MSIRHGLGISDKSSKDIKQGLKKHSAWKSTMSGDAS